jgi:uncharacterized membrane protein YkvA (DUF1232 family)
MTWEALPVRIWERSSPNVTSRTQYRPLFRHRPQSYTEAVIGFGPWLLIIPGVIFGSWATLVVLARTLPPGLARDLAKFLPDCVIAFRRLLADPRVPWHAKAAVGFGALWVLSPIDPIPDFMPVVGAVDEVIVAAVILRYLAGSAPREAVEDAWPGSPQMLERLLGSHNNEGSGP